MKKFEISRHRLLSPDIRAKVSKSDRDLEKDDFVPSKLKVVSLAD